MVFDPTQQQKQGVFLIGFIMLFLMLTNVNMGTQSLIQTQSLLGASFTGLSFGTLILVIGLILMPFPATTLFGIMLVAIGALLSVGSFLTVLGSLLSSTSGIIILIVVGIVAFVIIKKVF